MSISAVESGKVLFYSTSIVCCNLLTGLIKMAVENNSYEEGFLEINGLKLFYRRYGKGNRHKLLTLHGGPGGTHEYMLPLADLAERGFDVVFYDQFGCGKSDYPKNESDYSLEYAIEEVEGVRKALFGEEKVNLFGSSWGGLLSLAYAIKYQNHLITLTSCSGLSSVPETVKEMHRLISKLPDEYRIAIEVHEEKGDYDHPDYLKASDYFARQHVLRLEEWPDEVNRMMKMTAERGTYEKMNGPSEFTIIGTIKDIDFTDQLSKIRIPTLITCGKYDEVTPQIAETIRKNIPGSQLVVFQESSHLQFWEEREKYMEIFSGFVKEFDK